MIIETDNLLTIRNFAKHIGVKETLGHIIVAKNKTIVKVIIDGKTFVDIARTNYVKGCAKFTSTYQPKTRNNSPIRKEYTDRQLAILKELNIEL